MTVLDESASPIRSTGHGRVFRFDALDRGIVGRLGRTQLLILAGCGMVGFATVLSHRYVPVALALLAVGLVVTLPEPGGAPIVEWVPVWTRWFVTGRRSRRWYRALHLTNATAGVGEPSLPPWLGGLHLVDRPDHRYGVVHDTAAGTMTVVVPVAGRGFTTRTGDQMDLQVDEWGRMFAALGADAALQVVRVCWSQIARPATLDAHRQWAADQTGAASALSGVYQTHLANLRLARHDLVVSVTVQVGATRGDSAYRAAFASVDTAVAILESTFHDTGLDCGAIATVDELAWLTRTGLDPSGFPDDATAACESSVSLVQRLGLVPVAEAGPMATITHANRVEVDGVVHRCFWVAGWPETELGAGWFVPLLTHTETGIVQRTVTLVVEPIPDARATVEINADISRHGADAAAASGGAGRITARKQRKSDAAHAREDEVAAGYSPVAYSALVTLTAADADALAAASTSIVNRFSRARVTLRPMSMRMDVALAASLPLGLGLSRTEPN